MSRANQAFSIVEFLIAIFLTTIMVSMLYKSFEQSRRYYERYSRALMKQQERLIFSQYLYQLSRKAGLCDLVPLSRLKAIGYKAGKHLTAYGSFDKHNKSIPAFIRQSMTSGTRGFFISYVVPLSRIIVSINKSTYVKTQVPISVGKNQQLVICDEKNIEFLSLSKTINNRQSFYLDRETLNDYSRGTLIGVYQRVYLYSRHSPQQDALYFALEKGIKGEITRLWHLTDVVDMAVQPYPIYRLFFTDKGKQQFDLDVMLLNEKSL